MKVNEESVEVVEVVSWIDMEELRKINSRKGEDSKVTSAERYTFLV